MDFILIVGPPAVGKMTVGQELAKKLDFRLFYNHHSIELALNFFDWGDPEFGKINEGIRQLIFKTVSESKSIKGFIFTLVWAFNEQEDWDYVRELRNRFESNGWSFHVVELVAPTRIRLERNKTPNRLEFKASKRDVKASDNNLLKLDKKYRMNSLDKELEEFNYVKIDNSDLSPQETVRAIISALS